MTDKIERIPLKTHLMSPAIEGYFGSTPGQVRMVQAFASLIANDKSEDDVNHHFKQIPKEQVLMLIQQCDKLKELAINLNATK